MKWRIARLVVVLAGILIGQAILYGPSLVGRKLLLPLDILARQNHYLPNTPEYERIEPQNPNLSDVVLMFEPSRRFAAAEYHAGRIPMWAPYQYGGCPFIWPKFSPFLAFECLTESPVIVAWGQALAAMVAGLGAYAFFRRAIGISFWPAAVAAWCYPMTGFFVFWIGFPTSMAVYWLPWSLLAVDMTVRRRNFAAPIGLAVVTCLVLISGHLDVAGQVLMASGVYGLWRLWLAHGRELLRASERRTVLALALGWGLGFLLAMPHSLPLLSYVRTSARMIRRSAGNEERPPAGLAALPQAVLPDLYGANKPGSYRYFDNNQIETTAAAYSGMLATLVLAPLAWCNRRHRQFNWFCLLAVFLGLSWCLNIPGIVPLLRLPGLNMFSHNRWVFVSSFGILTLGAIGLEAFLTGPIEWRCWLWLPPTILAVVGVWCTCRIYLPPEPIATQLELALQNKHQLRWIQTIGHLREVQQWFRQHYAAAAVWCGISLASWVVVWLRLKWQSLLFPVLAALAVGDLIWFAHDRTPQCDPALYYPTLPALQQTARAAPGRVVGYDCLPAPLGYMCGLRDVRGYDSIDPAGWIDLLALVKSPRSRDLPYALVQWYTPRVETSPEGNLQLPPVLDMLGVRYLISRVPPPPPVHAAFHEQDYWVTVNSNVMDRVFIPRKVEAIADDNDVLLKMTSPDFNPREVAYVQDETYARYSGHGTVAILSETPSKVIVSGKMDSPGLVVLADLWDKGWHAYMNDHQIPIVRANHALRGVLLPGGAATIEFRYEPAGLGLGLYLAGLAAITLLGWAILDRFKQGQSSTSAKCNELNSALPFVNQ